MGNGGLLDFKKCRSSHQRCSLKKLFSPYSQKNTCVGVSFYFKISQNFDCANFRGPHVPLWVSWVSCHRALVPMWVLKFFLWVFRGSKIFSRGYFVGLKIFLVGIPWVQNFSLWVFCESRILRFSINFSKKQKQTYDRGILTESFK